MVWPDFFLLAQPTKLCKVWRNANLRLLVLLVLSVCYVRCSGGSPPVEQRGHCAGAELRFNFRERPDGGVRDLRGKKLTLDLSCPPRIFSHQRALAILPTTAAPGGFLQRLRGGGQGTGSGRRQEHFQECKGDGQGEEQVRGRAGRAHRGVLHHSDAPVFLV